MPTEDENSNTGETEVKEIGVYGNKKDQEGGVDEA